MTVVVWWFVPWLAQPKQSAWTFKRRSTCPSWFPLKTLKKITLTARSPNCPLPFFPVGTLTLGEKSVETEAPLEGWPCEWRAQLHSERSGHWSLVCTSKMMEQDGTWGFQLWQKLKDVTCKLAVPFEKMLGFHLVQRFCCPVFSALWEMFRAWCCACRFSRFVCAGDHGSGRCVPLLEPLCRTGPGFLTCWATSLLGPVGWQH